MVRFTHITMPATSLTFAASRMNNPLHNDLTTLYSVVKAFVPGCSNRTTKCFALSFCRFQTGSPAVFVVKGKGSGNKKLVEIAYSNFEDYKEMSVKPKDQAHDDSDKLLMFLERLWSDFHPKIADIQGDDKFQFYSSLFQASVDQFIVAKRSVNK